MIVTLELPSDLEAVLQREAHHQGLSVPDLLLRLAQMEGERPLYSPAEVSGFLQEDRLTPELSDKVQRLLGGDGGTPYVPKGRV